MKCYWRESTAGLDSFQVLKLLANRLNYYIRFSRKINRKGNVMKETAWPLSLRLEPRSAFVQGLGCIRF